MRYANELFDFLCNYNTRESDAGYSRDGYNCRVSGTGVVIRRYDSAGSVELLIERERRSHIGYRSVFRFDDYRKGVLTVTDVGNVSSEIVSEN